MSEEDNEVREYEDDQRSKTPSLRSQNLDASGLHSVHEVSSVDSSDNEIEAVEDTSSKIMQTIKQNPEIDIINNQQVVKRIYSIFMKERTAKEGEAREEANLISRYVILTFVSDEQTLDKIDTQYISIYNPIMRQRIRENNQRQSEVLHKFVYDEKTIIELICLLMERKTNNVDQEEDQLLYLKATLELTLLCFELGLFTAKNIRKFILQLFLTTEKMFKIEQHLIQDQDSFRDEIFELAMECKSLSSRVVFQLVTLVNDSWFYKEVVTKHKQNLEKIAVQKTESAKSATCISKLKHCFSKKNLNQKVADKDHTIFFEDIQYYSLFCFMMFNYLLPELHKGNRRLKCVHHQEVMHHLIVYVYEYRCDSFMLSLHLLKPDYIGYYLDEKMDPDHVYRADKILKEVLGLLGCFGKAATLVGVQKGIGESQAGVQNNGLNLRSAYYDKYESKITQIFSELEMLMGLQDETFSIRLLLTEKKIPELIIEIFVYMQNFLLCEPGDELFLQGIKVLYQLCRGNYPGQAQITKGGGWTKLKELLTGNFAVFSILFLKQLFEEQEDCSFLHINKTFAFELVDIFASGLETFLTSFTYENIGASSKEMVYLYCFQLLMRQFLKERNVEAHLREHYSVPITRSLHSTIINFVIPLFRENPLKIESIYEPKLIKKNWKLEDGSFLISLMMLTGHHIKSMVIDFAYSALRVYNLSTEKYIPGSCYDDLQQSLPFQTSCYNFLFTFSEGIKFKTEILLSYTNLRVFAHASKINQSYSASELSVTGSDTNQEYLPKSNLSDIPKMIINEIFSFEHAYHENLQREEVMEYILKGICQLAYKFVQGLIWYFSAVDSEENVKILSKYIHEMNQKFHMLKHILIKMKKVSSPGRATLSSNRMEMPFNDSEQVILGSSIASLLSNLSNMLENTPYSWIMKHYTLNKKYVPLSELLVVRGYLLNQATYLSYLKSQANIQPEVVLDKDASLSESELVGETVARYSKLKKKFMLDATENQFYKVLQSKMGNINQFNLMTYVINWLGVLDIEVTSNDSIWVNKSSIQMLIFLSNTLFWCPNSRIKLYEALETVPEIRKKLITIVYKGMRDSFTILNYNPFFNDHWEYMYFRYYTFSSFIMGLCKQNCQEFKAFLGEFTPDMGCSQHRKMKFTLLADLMNILVKSLNYSGISYNKAGIEKSSDRLSTVNVTEILIRCIIDMLSGPCKANQIKVYPIGTQIWLNMLTRLVTDLNSKYYKLLDLILDYLLSLLEGNDPVIMNFFASNFDVPVMYSFMANLMNLLYKKALGRMLKRGTIKSLTNTQIADKLKKQPPLSSRKPSREDTNQIGKTIKSLEKKKQLNDTSGNILDTYYGEFAKLSDWQQLIYMYRNGDFDAHVTLECSIKIFIFLSRVAYTSKKYQIFFDKKEKDLHEQYVKSGFKEEDIKTNKVNLSGTANASEDLIVYYFMKNITARVEIRDNNMNSEIFIFPKPPCCFFLKEATMINFINTCQIENTEAKLTDMFDNFDQFQLEMQNYQKFKSKHRALGLLATDRSFTIFRLGCYLISVLINFLICIDARMIDNEIYLDHVEMIVFVLSCLLAALSTMVCILWIFSNFTVAWSSVLKKFSVRYPYRNPLMPNNLIVLLADIFLKRDVINFLLHTVIAVLGVLYSPIIHSLHLILIINISDTTKYVLKAVTEHADQLLATVTLVIIIIYIFSNVIGLYYGNEFSDEETEGLYFCTSLASCYLNVLNLGLTRGGGIAESMNMTDINSVTINFYYKLLTQLGFYVFVNIICLNVIFGIIIDTFSELRDRQRLREWDQYNMCDICGIERKVFEKKGMNFDIHKGVQHNLWDYVFYLVYLQTLDVQSLTGFEYFVFSQFKNKSTAWLPINSTLFLKSNRDDEQLQINQLEKKMTEFRAEVITLVDTRFSSLQKMMLGLGRRVDRALQTLKETKDCLQGETKNEGETGKEEDEYGERIYGYQVEEIRLINVE